MNDMMRDMFGTLAHSLKMRQIDPTDVEVVIHFRQKRDHDSFAYAIGQEFEQHAREPVIASHVNKGEVYGIRFKLA